VSAITGLGYVFSTKGLRTQLIKGLVKTGYRAAFRHPNLAVVFQNPDDRADFLREKIVQPQCAVLIKGSGVDMAEFAPQPSQATSSALVICASRMLHSKGIGDFVAAAKQLVQGGVNARFALVGDSDPKNPKSISRAELALWTTEAGIEWWGRRDDMARVMAQAEVVCLPSVYREGVPKVLIEAAAAGRAIAGAVEEAVGARGSLTPDLGGSSRTDEMAAEIAGLLRRPEAPERAEQVQFTVGDPVCFSPAGEERVRGMPEAWGLHRALTHHESGIVVETVFDGPEPLVTVEFESGSAHYWPAACFLRSP